MGSNDSSFRFKREIARIARALLDKTREAARPVSAHFSGAAVVIVKFPGPIRLPRGARDQQDSAVRTHAAMAIAKTNDLLARQLEALRPIVNQDKVVTRAVH